MGLIVVAAWAVARFQSTPDLVNRENFGYGLSRCFAKLFQSTPDLVNRENSSLSSTHGGVQGFNPLPI